MSRPRGSFPRPAGGPVRRLAAAACLALAVPLALAGCSGDDGGASSDAPEDAALEDYCAAYTALYDEVLTEAASGDSAAMVRAFRAWADDLEEVGTPAEMPDDARNGFELFVEQAGEIEEDATLADLEAIVDELGESDQADADAFSQWTLDNCPIDLPDVPGLEPGAEE